MDKIIKEEKMDEYKELNEDDMESILYHGVAKGDIDLKGLKDGQGMFAITEQGEERVAEIAGGKDVLEATSMFLAVLCENGAMGFDVENDATTFALIASMLKAFKRYENWQTLMQAIK